jgi:hypothetical protein
MLSARIEPAAARSECRRSLMRLIADDLAAEHSRRAARCG